MTDQAKLSGLRGLLFDKDGTMLDFQATWGRWSVGVIENLAEGDEALTARLADRLGIDMKRGLIEPTSVVVAGSPEEIGEAALAVLPHFDAETIAARFLEMSHDVVAVALGNVSGLFGELKAKGLRLGVATNDGEEIAINQMQALGLSDMLEYTAGYNSGYGGKPGPGMCLGFCKATGLEPGQVGMVGDSLHDLHAGRAAGMVCIAVTSGLASADDLRGHADIVLDDVHALPALFG